MSYKASAMPSQFDRTSFSVDDPKTVGTKVANFLNKTTHLGLNKRGSPQASWWRHDEREKGYVETVVRVLGRTLVLAFSIFFVVFGPSYSDEAIDTSVYGNWMTKNYGGGGLTYSAKIAIEKDKFTFTLNCKRDMDGISVSSIVSVPVHITSDYIQTLDSSSNKIEKYMIECKANISQKKIFYKVEDNYLFIFKSKDKKKLITTYSRSVK